MRSHCSMMSSVSECGMSLVRHKFSRGFRFHALLLSDIPITTLKNTNNVEIQQQHPRSVTPRTRCDFAAHRQHSINRFISVGIAENVRYSPHSNNAINTNEQLYDYINISHISRERACCFILVNIESSLTHFDWKQTEERVE